MHHGDCCCGANIVRPVFYGRRRRPTQPDAGNSPLRVKAPCVQDPQRTPARHAGVKPSHEGAGYGAQ